MSQTNANLGESDAALMQQVAAGESEAFGQLIARYQHPVINTIYRAIGDRWEAEDLAQRVFLQVYRAAPRYRAKAKFTTWLFTIVHNIIRNEYRRRSRHPAASLEELQETNPSMADPTTADPATTAAANELQEQIQTAIANLPTQQRTALILCRYQGSSYEEIAAVLGCSVSAVKSLLHRARITLRDQIKWERG